MTSVIAKFNLPLNRMDTMNTEWTLSIETSIYMCLLKFFIGRIGLFALGQDLENDEVLLSLDRDILELQKDKARLETSMIELRSQIGAMESSLRQRVRENKALEENIQHLTKYYEFMKKTNKC